MAEKKVASPMDIIQNLPGEDCEECGLDTCFEFALRLVDGRERYDRCPKLTKKHEKALKKLLQPPMREVTIGVGEKARRIGGEKVMHREDMCFFGKTVIAYDVWDTMSEERLKERVKEINELKVTRIKEVYGPDAVAVRCVSDDPRKFKTVVKMVAELTELPLILCSFNAKALKSAIKIVSESKPVLYAATKDNWAEVLDIAKNNNVVVAIFSPDDLDTLGRIAKTFSKAGIEDLILDPGTFCEASSIQKTINNYIMLKHACVERRVKEVSYPIMAVPAVASLIYGDKNKAAHLENLLASALITKGISLLIMHEINLWSFMPLILLREDIFKHPKAEMTVDPGIYEFGKPDENSPVLTTANYSLTYGMVSSTLERSKVNCYLLVADTGGLSLDTIAGTGQYPDILSEAVETFKLKEKVKHRVLIIGEVVAEYKPDIEEALPDWKIVIGPHDPGEVKDFLESKWKEFIETS